MFVAIAYLVANGVLFVAKFVIYHLFLFGDGAPERVSQHPRRTDHDAVPRFE